MVKLTKDMLRVGKQVAYIPSHVIEKCGSARRAIVTDADDVEYGFVSSWNEQTIFCRFWSLQFPKELRTTANSEGCNIEDLYLYPSRMQSVVDDRINALRTDPERWGWHEQGDVK